MKRLLPYILILLSLPGLPAAQAFSSPSGIFESAPDDSILTLMRAGSWLDTIVISANAVLIAHNRVWGPGSIIKLTYDADRQALLGDGFLLRSVPRPPAEVEKTPKEIWMNAVSDTIRAHPEMAPEDRIAYALDHVDGTGVLDPQYMPVVEGAYDYRVKFAGFDCEVHVSLPGACEEHEPPLRPEAHCLNSALLFTNILQGGRARIILQTPSSSSIFGASPAILSCLSLASRGKLDEACSERLREKYIDPDSLIFQKSW